MLNFNKAERAYFAPQHYSPDEWAVLTILMNCGDMWEAFEPDQLTETQSKALSGLVRRGLISRRNGLRYRIANSATTIECAIQYSGEACDPDSDPLARAVEAAQFAWRNELAEFRDATGAAVVPCQPELIGPFELRLTESGVTAASHIHTRDRQILDFVFRRGKFAEIDAVPRTLEIIRLEVVRQAATPAPPEVEQGDKPPAPPSGFEETGDFSWVRWRGEEFTFSPQQARCVKILHENYINGKKPVSVKALLSEIESMSDRIRDVFKGHPALDKLILRSDGGKLVRLADF